MKRSVTIGLIVLSIVITGSAHSEVPPTYLALYDSENQGSYCVSGNIMDQVDLYVFCIPNRYGIVGLEFRLDYPENVIAVSPVFNPIIEISPMGELSTGIAMLLPDCGTEMVWAIHQTLYITGLEKSSISIERSNLNGGPTGYPFPIYTCCDSPLYPIHELRILNRYYVNYTDSDPECGVLATGVESWGAIKSLYR